MKPFNVRTDRARVNPATVVQAYRELEAEGFVEMKQGAGTFVSEVGNAKRSAERAEQARRIVRGMLSEAARLGLDPDEIAETLFWCSQNPAINGSVLHANLGQVER